MKNGAALALVLMLTDASLAEDWPARPVTMVVPFAAGGAVDAVARVLAPRLGELLGQQVVIENMGGAGGMMAGSRVAKAAPDGYTFLLGGIATLALNQTLYRKPLYNAAADFAPVALVSDQPRVLITRKDLPVQTLEEFIAYARANPSGMQYASAGPGSGSHVCAMLLDAAMGTRMTHVPYRGTAPALQDLMAGRIDFTCEQISSAVGQIRAGNVKAVAMMGPDRVSVLPEVSSAAEFGLRDLDCGAWAALVLPKRTPEQIVRRLAKAANDTVATPGVRERLESMGVTVPPAERRTTEYLAGFVPLEIARWAKPIKATGVVLD